jgi:transposase
MITPSGNFKFYIATEPVDFRKGMDGLASIVLNEFDLDPFRPHQCTPPSARNNQSRVGLAKKNSKQVRGKVPAP